MTDVPLTRSVRLIFEFTAGDVRLLEQHPVRIPKSVTVGPVPDQHSNDYVEIRNRDGRTISRIPVWTGLGSTVETFPQDPYIGADVPRVLTVVVPVPPDADHVAVVRGRHDGGRNAESTTGAAAVEVLGTFRLQR